MLVPRDPECSQKHEIFINRCTINKKVCDVIIDGGSSENVVSKTLMKAMGLTTQKHLRTLESGVDQEGT